jgi:hypothetical protein
MRRTWLLTLVIAVLLGLFLLIRGSRQTFDSGSVVTQVQKLNELATVRYTVQKVVGLEEYTQPVGTERILIVVQAQVTAGVDLSTLREQDVQRRDDGTVSLKLPPARVLNVAIDEKQTRVWDRKKTWWTPWVPYSKDLEQKARMQGIEDARQTAIEMGILRQAERNAEESIRTLLGLAGVKSVVVVPASQS